MSKKTFDEFKEERDDWEDECKAGGGGGFDRVMEAYDEMQAFHVEHDALEALGDAATDEEKERLQEVIDIETYAMRNMDK